MPFRDPDPTDPNILVGVMLPAEAEVQRDMAYVFAEEFARIGHDRKMLLGLFQNPFYAGAHGAYRDLGEKEILSIIDECLNAWGRVQFSISDFGRESQSNDSGFSIEEEPGKSKIHNPKSKIEEGGR